MGPEGLLYLLYSPRNAIFIHSHIVSATYDLIPNSKNNSIYHPRISFRWIANKVNSRTHLRKQHCHLLFRRWLFFTILTYHEAVLEYYSLSSTSSSPKLQTEGNNNSIKNKKNYMRFIARNISRFPGAPGSFSIENPTLSIAFFIEERQA